MSDSVVVVATHEALARLIREAVRAELDAREASRAPVDASAEWMSVAQVAARAGRCTRTITGAISRGDLAAERFGARLRVRRADAEAWLAARTRPAVTK